MKVENLEHSWPWLGSLHEVSWIVESIYDQNEEQ